MPNAVQNTNQAPYNAVCLVGCTVNRADNNQAMGTGWGSGSLLSSSVALTCGHNLLSQSGTPHYSSAIRVWNGYSSASAPTSGGVAAAHGLYFNSWHNGDRSWDIAVLRLTANINVPNYFAPQSVQQEPDNNMRIAGYPSDHHYAQWEDQEIWNGVNIQEHVFAYQHATQPGSSGSPVYKAFVAHGSGQLQIHQYGVHIGLPNQQQQEERVGVLLTPVTYAFVRFAATCVIPQSSPFLIRVTAQHIQQNRL